MSKVPARSPPSFTVLRFLHTFFILRAPFTALLLLFFVILPFLHCGATHFYPYSLIVGLYHQPRRLGFLLTNTLDMLFERLFTPFTQFLQFLRQNCCTSPSTRLNYCSLSDKAQWVTQFAQIVPRGASPGCPMTKIQQWPIQVMLL